MYFDDWDRAGDWDMSYDNLILKRGLGKGNSGLIALGCLHDSPKLPKIIDFIKRQRAQEGCYHPRLVAVKQFKGWTLCKCIIYVCDVYSPLKFSTH